MAMEVLLGISLLGIQVRHLPIQEVADDCPNGDDACQHRNIGERWMPNRPDDVRCDQKLQSQE